MKNIVTSAVQKTQQSKVLWLGAGLMAVVLALGFASPAHADWHGGRRGPPPRHWHGPHYAPSYVYAPPPPPVYAQPVEPVSTGINLIVPLHFH